MFLSDNARRHIAYLVKDKLQRFGREILHPPHSPDLSPCDFHIFGNHIRGCQFHSDDEVQVFSRTIYISGMKFLQVIYQGNSNETRTPAKK